MLFLQRHHEARWRDVGDFLEELTTTWYFGAEMCIRDSRRPAQAQRRRVMASGPVPLILPGGGCALPGLQDPLTGLHSVGPCKRSATRPFHSRASLRWFFCRSFFARLSSSR